MRISVQILPVLMFSALLLLFGCQDTLVSLDDLHTTADDDQRLLNQVTSLRISGKNARPARAVYAVYMWSKTFESLDNAYVIEQLQRHQIGEVLLSLGSSGLLLQKAEAFIRDAKRAKISVHLLVASPVLIFPRNYERLERLVSDARALRADGIHLDVEPHTLDDWSTNREVYLAQYVAMVREARRLAGSRLTVGVSTITSYGQETIEALLEPCDDITFMVYAKTDPGSVESKIRELVALDPPKMRLALRPEDFGSVETLWDFMEILQRADTINRFALQDFGSLLLVSGH